MCPNRSFGMNSSDSHRGGGERTAEGRRTAEGPRTLSREVGRREANAKQRRMQSADDGGRENGDTQRRGRRTRSRHTAEKRTRKRSERTARAEARRRGHNSERTARQQQTHECTAGADARRGHRTEARRQQKQQEERRTAARRQHNSGKKSESPEDCGFGAPKMKHIHDMNISLGNLATLENLNLPDLDLGNVD